MNDHIYAVLLAGGQGSRFWPQSRTLEPKQFLCLHKDSTLFEQTVRRIQPLLPLGNIFIVTSGLYRAQLRELLQPFAIPPENLIFEPEGKNTAPSIAAACRLISLRDPDARIVVLPCDHLIRNRSAFLSSVRRAFAASDDRLIVFGIPPERPATGYGYIKAGKTDQRKDIVGVSKFCEKPQLATAKKFLAAGSYYWNSGIFVGAVRVFQEEFKKHLPELFRVLSGVSNHDDLVRVWKKLTPVSFDYGILEKTRNIGMVVSSNLGWSDLGSWQAWDEMLKKDRDGNAFKGDVINVGSRNTTIWSSKRLVAAIGLDDLIIVDTPDALLVTRKSASENVRKVVDTLKASGRQEHYYHLTVKRPWGRYTLLDTGIGFKIKLVEVLPGRSLSLQFHRRRSEHWVVVAGTAKIVRNKRWYMVKENESTFIPIGCKHRIVNPGAGLLKIVEVQSGAYLEEDDIVRLKDDFGRANTGTLQKGTG
jgi:mannose-1-phosphate guanylyltransferase / mannose-6-phosphate isomerase